MYQKLLLATLTAILANAAFAQPIYYTANELRANPPATVGVKTTAAEYPAHLNQAIYFTANKVRTVGTPAAVVVRNDVANQPIPGQPIYFAANHYARLDADKQAPAN